MLVVTRQNHLAAYDQKQSYKASFLFDIQPQDRPKNKNDADLSLKLQIKENLQSSQIQIKSQYRILFHIQNKFQYEWQSEIFDLEVEANEYPTFGNIPFSLQTFLQIYKNPKHWNIILRPKSDDIDFTSVKKGSVGKLLISTYFSENPFLVPVQCLTQNLQCQKTIKVIIEDRNNQQVVCSGELKSIEDVQVDNKVFVSNRKRAEDHKLYTFTANENVGCQHICVIKGSFKHQQLEHNKKKIHIYSANNKPVEYIPNLQKTMKMLKIIDHDIIILQNVDTQIEDSHRLIFYTDLTSLYAKIFRSFLYSKIYDKWIIQGMVHYNKDNRHFQDIIQELTELLTDGEQLFPLCNGDYAFDNVWKIKAKFIYHVLANLSELDLTRGIIEQFSRKKRKLTSAMIFKKMKNNIGKEKLKTIYENQFINCTGINRILYDMEHQKRERKIKITLRQKSLACGVFRRYNRNRIKLEQNYGLVSEIMEKIIKKNEGRRNEMSGPLAVPKFLKCLPYFTGPVNIQIENSDPFEEQLQEQNIVEKIIDAKLNTRIRKQIGKKNELESSDTISWMMMDTSMTFPAVYKGKYLSEAVIESLVKKTYENEIQQLKVLNSISIKEHSESLTICKLLIEKIKVKSASKISVKRKILQILPNFIEKANDLVVWDEILQLLQLYEPVCYDYSEEGAIFLISLIESIGNIVYILKYSLYFEEFHRIFLAISRYHHEIRQEKFQYLQKQIFKSIMKWRSKYSFQILQQAKNYLELTLTNPKVHLNLNKIIIQNVLPYIDQLKVKKEELKVVQEIDLIIKDHVLLDNSGTIRATIFHYETKKNQILYPSLKFFDLTFTDLEKIKETEFTAYDKCLEKFKQILNKNRDKYSLDVQMVELNQNQNYYLAEYLWRNMCSEESLNNAKIRLAWIKIYRIFYFYFTPIITIVKLNKNNITKEFPLNDEETFEILNNIMDFNPDIKWFSVYDSSNTKKKKVEKKKEAQQYIFDENEKNMFTNYINQNSGKQSRKDSPEQLTKFALQYLIKHYENQEINISKISKGSGQQKYKKIIEGLKGINQLLKKSSARTTISYEQVPQKVFNLLCEYSEQDTLAHEVFDLLTACLENLNRQKRQRQLRKSGDMRISLLNFDYKGLDPIHEENGE